MPSQERAYASSRPSPTWTKRRLDRSPIDRQQAPDGEPDNVILLGDFNVFNQKGDKTTAALEKHKFFIPKEIQEIPAGSNVARDKFYDQIAFHDPGRRLRTTPKSGPKAGVFDFTKSTFREEDVEHYDAEMRLTDPKKYPSKARTKEGRLKYFRQWRTFQTSDHLPLWIELQVDFSDGYIAARAGLPPSKKASSAKKAPSAKHARRAPGTKRPRRREG